MTLPLIYLDGEWVSPEEAKLSVFDHGVLYGDGVFEGIRAYNGRVFKLRQHMDRLYQSAKIISLTIPMEQQKLTAIVEQSIQKNNLTDAYIRLLVTRGVGDLGLDPRACPNPSIVVIADKLALFPERCYKEGLEAIFAKTRRNLVEAMNPIVKSMNYLNNILAKIEANNKGVPEAILLNYEGYVSECTGDNVFFIKNKTVFTPPVSVGVLEGITRSTVMEILHKISDYSVQEKLFYPDELLGADEVFFTGTAAEVIPVTKIDGKPIGSGKPGTITQELMRLFREHTNEESLIPQKN
ncbi:branched-chain-amino-acid transaminase [bacterium F11]|nr:branched-chain-amino-acid transaminase [bacterium F11]